MKRFHLVPVLTVMSLLVATALIPAKPPKHDDHDKHDKHGKPDKHHTPPPPPPPVVWSGAGDGDVVKLNDKDHPKAILLTSEGDDATANARFAPTFGAIIYTPAKTLTFDKLTTLRTNLKVVFGGYGGGSPRFQITVPNGNSTANVFVYMGTAPQFQDDPVGWQDTGNFINPSDTSPRWDLSQLGGPFNATYAEAAAFLDDTQVLEISVGVDGGWFFGYQEYLNGGDDEGVQAILFDDVTVNKDVLHAGDFHYDDDAYEGDAGDF